MDEVTVIIHDLNSEGFKKLKEFFQENEINGDVYLGHGLIDNLNYIAYTYPNPGFENLNDKYDQVDENKFLEILGE